MLHMCQTSRPCELMEVRLVARGFTAESILNRGIIVRPRASLVAIHLCNGALPGLLTGAFSIIALRLTHRGVPGRSARSTSGGMRKRSNGQAMTFRIFP